MAIKATINFDIKGLELQKFGVGLTPIKGKVNINLENKKKVISGEVNGKRF